MKADIIAASAVGESNEHHWSQAIIGIGWYAVVEIKDENGRARNIGMRVVAALSEWMKIPPPNALYVEDIISKLHQPEIVGILIAFPVGHTMHFLIRGIASAYMKRHDRFALLSQNSGTISGVMEKGDIFLGVTQACEETMGQNEMLLLFDHLPATDIGQQLALRFHGADQQPGMGAIILEVNSVDKDVVDEREPVSSEDKKNINAVIAQSDWLIKAKRFIRPRTRLIAAKRKITILLRRFRAADVRLTVGILLLFLISIIIGIQRQMSMRLDSATLEAIGKAKGKYEEGVALSALNPIKARQALQDAKDLVMPLLPEVSQKTKAGRDLVALSDSINSALTTAKRVYENEPVEFYDPALLKTGSRVTDIEIFDDTIALIDPTERSIYAISISTKNGQIIGGGDGFESATLNAIHGDTIYVLGPGGIHAISIRDKKTQKNIIKGGPDEWGKAKKITAFAGNIYILDSQKNRIWKYIKTDTGFSDRKEYLTQDTTADFSIATGISIDGSVFVGRTDGVIKKYTQGREDVFVPQGIDPEISGSVMVSVSDENEKVYVLEPSAHRVIVLAKDGMYEAQYVWKNQITPIGFAVSEKAGTILLLADGKLFSIPLK